SLRSPPCAERPSRFRLVLTANPNLDMNVPSLSESRRRVDPPQIDTMLPCRPISRHGKPESDSPSWVGLQLRGLERLRSYSWPLLVSDLINFDLSLSCGLCGRSRRRLSRSQARSSPFAGNRRHRR